jgi:Protein of unknown function (DUF1214)
MTRIAIALAALLVGPSAVRASPVGIPETQWREGAAYPISQVSGKNLVVVIAVARRPPPAQTDSGPSYVGLLGVDSDGRPLDGAHRYLLHFTKDELPPVRARWSLTALETDPFRDGSRGSDGMLGQERDLHYNPDHSLDIYLQHEPPGPGRRANWLRIPSAPFNLVAHVRWPSPTVVERDWSVPSVKRLD